MIKFNNKILSIIINFFLLIWQLPQILTGIFGLIVFHNFEWYTNEDAGITVLKVNKGRLFGGACFSSGPIIFVTPNCEELTLKHETGHSVQSLLYGFLFHIIISIPSICLFWYRRLAHKDMKFYYSHWPEFQAEELGHTNRNKTK